MTTKLLLLYNNKTLNQTIIYTNTFIDKSETYESNWIKDQTIILNYYELIK